MNQNSMELLLLVLVNALVVHYMGWQNPRPKVRYGGIRHSSVSPRPPCDGTPSSFIWPSPRQTPGPSCPYPSDRPPSGHHQGRRHARHAYILQIGLHLTQTRSLWTPLGMVQPSYLEKESDDRNPLQGVAPHVRRRVIGELRRWEEEAECSNHPIKLYCAILLT